MSVRPILTIENKRLRSRAHAVRRYQLVTGLVLDLRDTLEHHQAAGLAAPQIGVPLRVIIASGEFYVNPEIVRVSTDWVLGTEGCLSIPGYVADVWRHGSVRVKATDTRGRLFRVTLEGMEARVIQHEIDHLDGKLILDVPHEKFRLEGR